MWFTYVVLGNFGKVTLVASHFFLIFVWLIFHGRINKYIKDREIFNFKKYKYK